MKGFQQREGIDFNQIFSHVVKLTTIRAVLSIVAAEDLHLEQLDMKPHSSMAIWRIFTCCRHRGISCCNKSAL